MAAEAYHDPGRHRHERQAIFARTWQLVGAADAVAEPGAYLAVDLAGWPIVVVRDRDGVLRAFHNVCRHRAGPLVDDGAGACSRFVCRYHGWAYGLDGDLVSARDFSDDDLLDPASLALVAVRVESWRGLVFVNLDPAAAPLVDSFAGVVAASASFPMEDFRFAHEFHEDVDCDWKAYADNYLEGYHLPLVHPELTREVVAEQYRVMVGDRFVEHTVPPRDGAINAGRWLWQYPNLALNLYPDAMNVEHYLPLGPGRVRITYRYFFRDPTAPDPEVERMSRTILSEDRRICEAVQRNLEAGVYTPGPLSPRHEPAVAAFQRWVTEDVARTGVG
jgi:choline monooxygenase